MSFMWHVWQLLHLIVFDPDMFAFDMFWFEPPTIQVTIEPLECHENYFDNLFLISNLVFKVIVFAGEPSAPPSFCEGQGPTVDGKN